jgi:hypothetical protein
VCHVGGSVSVGTTPRVQLLSLASFSRVCVTLDDADCCCYSNGTRASAAVSIISPCCCCPAATTAVARQRATRYCSPQYLPNHRPCWRSSSHSSTYSEHTAGGRSGLIQSRERCVLGARCCHTRARASQPGPPHSTTHPVGRAQALVGVLVELAAGLVVAALKRAPAAQPARQADA